MAKKSDLMGLGMSVFLAGRLANSAVIATAVGATINASYVVGGDQYLTFVITASAANAGVVLPAVGGSGSMAGALVGDEFKVINDSAAAINLYINDVTSFIIDGVSVSGSFGVSVSVGGAVVAYPITASTWVGLRFGSGA
jgi:hypothetical protein